MRATDGCHLTQLLSSLLEKSKRACTEHSMSVLYYAEAWTATVVDW